MSGAKRTTQLLIASAFLAGACSVAAGQQQLTLAAAVRFALTHNPELVAARARVDSANAELAIARAYPNPLLQATPALPSQYSLTFPIDVGPQRHYRVLSQRRGIAAAAHDSSDVRRQVLFSVRQAYCDAQLSSALSAIAGEDRDIVRELLTADSVRLRAGAIPLRDVVKSRVELSRAEAQLARAQVSTRAARLALQVVMGVSRLDTAINIADSLDSQELWTPPDSALAQLGMHRADMLASIDRVAASRSDVSFARSLLLPTPTLGVVSQPRQPFTSGLHYAIAIGVGVPLFNWFSGERSRAATSLFLAEQARDRQSLQVRAEIAATRDSLNTSRAVLYRYQAGVGALSDSALTMSRYAYTAGATSLVDLFDALRTQSAVRAEYEVALHDYRVSVFALRRATDAEPTETNP